MAIAYSDKVADAVGTVSDTYNISGTNNQLSISIDGGSAQVFTLTSGSTRTAAQIVSDLAALTGATASVVTVNATNFVRIRTSSANGATSTIQFNAPSNNANNTLGFIATTYTGGANVDTVLIGDTKQNLINSIETALLAAGWITVSGHGSTNLLMQSAMTPNPQNLRMRINIKDNGNNCVVASILTTNGSKVGTNGTSNGAQLFPATSKSWRIMANKYQAFVMVPGASNAREFAAWGVPSIPSWLQNGVLYECIHLHGNAVTDTDTTVRQSMRTVLGTFSNVFANPIMQQVITNNYLWENGNGNIGSINLFTTTNACWGSNGNGNLAPNNVRWYDGSALMSDPLIGWGLTQTTDECMIRGQLWDAFISSESYPSETYLQSVDSHNWRNVTSLNNGLLSSYSRGTLFLVVP